MDTNGDMLQCTRTKSTALGSSRSIQYTFPRCASNDRPVAHHVSFTQIVHLFMKYDEDGSGELDVNEMRKLMFESDVRGERFMHALVNALLQPESEILWKF